MYRINSTKSYAEIDVLQQKSYSAHKRFISELKTFLKAVVIIIILKWYLHHLESLKEIDVASAHIKKPRFEFVNRNCTQSLFNVHRWGGAVRLFTQSILPFFGNTESHYSHA